MRKWFMAARPLVSPGELDALADRMLEGCANARNLRAAMLLAHRDRYTLWFLRPRLFQFIAAVHGEDVATRRLATLDDWMESKDMTLPGIRRRGLDVPARLRPPLGD